MKEIVFDRTIVKATVYGKEQILSAPSNHEYFEYLDQLTESSKGTTQELMSFLDEYLASRGMDKDVAAGMELAHKQRLVKIINGEADEEQKKS